jgi:exodeoxyribonuclease VII large subunit
LPLQHSKPNKEILSVSEYLDLLNDVLGFTTVRIIGEVGQFTKRGNALYFSIRDKNDQSVLNCFMWVSDYRLSGVEIQEGMEIIVTGLPEIYKPSGRLSLRLRTIELVGEGELKKAYDALRKKLENEGLFDPELKKQIKEYPKKVGLITSKEGAVIHDFLNNLNRRGFEISFINSRVEGVRAVADLREAITLFKNVDLDVLVIIRGGGSLESFIAFNNEMIIREMKNLPFPVIAGLGHDKDVPLISLASDLMVSTPTAVTAILNESWNKGDAAIALHEHKLLSWVRNIKTGIINTLEMSAQRLTEGFKVQFNQAQSNLILAESVIKNSDPSRQLRLGYSITRIEGKILRSAKSARTNQKIITQLSDGEIESSVI